MYSTIFTDRKFKIRTMLSSDRFIKTRTYSLDLIFPAKLRLSKTSKTDSSNISRVLLLSLI